MPENLELVLTQIVNQLSDLQNKFDDLNSRLTALENKPDPTELTLNKLTCKQVICTDKLITSRIDPYGYNYQFGAILITGSINICRADNNPTRLILSHEEQNGQGKNYGLVGYDGKSVYIVVYENGLPGSYWKHN